MLRGRKVLLDADLAQLYGVRTSRLNEQVKRNLDRFPADFAFRLTDQELKILMSQIAISSYGTAGHGGTRKRPLVFTEHGAMMAACVLDTPRAIQVSVFVVRAFVQLREALGQHAKLAAQLDKLERKVESLAMRHDSLAASTREQVKNVIETLRQLMSTPEPARRPIGFVTPTRKS
jgi:hypothetical protein